MSLSPGEVDEATARGAVRVARCAACGAEQAMPATTCFACGGATLVARAHEGTGRIYSWVRTHVAFEPKYEAEVPYTVLIVALDGGARVYGRLARADEAAGALRADLAVDLDPAETRARGCPVFALRRGA